MMDAMIGNTDAPAPGSAVAVIGIVELPADRWDKDIFDRPEPGSQGQDAHAVRWPHRDVGEDFSQRHVHGSRDIGLGKTDGGLDMGFLRMGTVPGTEYRRTLACGIDVRLFEADGSVGFTYNAAAFTEDTASDLFREVVRPLGFPKASIR